MKWAVEGNGGESIPGGDEETCELRLFEIWFNDGLGSIIWWLDLMILSLLFSLSISVLLKWQIQLCSVFSNTVSYSNSDD